MKLITRFKKRKFDNILANPPFGIKGLKYDDFCRVLDHEWFIPKPDPATIFRVPDPT